MVVDRSTRELVYRCSRPCYWCEIDLLCNAWGSVRSSPEFLQIHPVPFLGCYFLERCSHEISLARYSLVVRGCGSLDDEEHCRQAGEMGAIMYHVSLLFILRFIVWGFIGRNHCLSVSGDILQAGKENPNVDMSNSMIYTSPGSTPAGEPAVGSAPVNFAAVDPALYGLRRSERAQSRRKNLSISYTHHPRTCPLAGAT